MSTPPKAAGKDTRFTKESWSKKKAERKEDGVTVLRVPGMKDGFGYRKVNPATDGTPSVFRLAIEGLDTLRQSYSDGDLMAASISVAEGATGYGTSEDREVIILIGSGSAQRKWLSRVVRPRGSNS